MAEFGYHTWISTLLPSELDTITAQIVARFVDAVTDDVTGTHYDGLLGVEQSVLAFSHRLGREMMQAFVNVRLKQVLADRAPCSCGQRPEVLQRRHWTLQTRVGAISVADPYTYCRVCHEKDRPAHAWLGSQSERWSLLVQEAAVDLAADESFGKAVGKLARHHPGVEMGRTTALRLVHHHGAEAREFIDAKLGAARAGSASGELPGEPAAELEAEHDAGMIPVATMEPIPVPDGQKARRTPVRDLPVRRKAARWEEVKAGLIQRPGEKKRLYALRPTGELDAAFDDLLGLACLMGWNARTAVRGLADGAVHIRQRMAQVFEGSAFRFILDRPHCKEHLSAAGTELKPFTGLDGQEWAGKALKKLENGEAADVVAELRAAYMASGEDEASRNGALKRAAGYFERNQDAVAYAEYREHGWSTASSEIESGHRHTVQARMKISGAWWHPDGVDHILALRMLKANGWWDEYWTYQRQKWRARAQELAAKRPVAA